MRPATFCTVAVVVVAFALAGCEARLFRTHQLPLADMTETSTGSKGLGDFAAALKGRLGFSSSSESDSGDEASRSPEIIAKFSSSFRKMIKDTMDAFEDMKLAVTKGSRQEAALESAERTCHFDSIKELMATNDNEDLAVASQYFSTDCYVVIMNAYKQIEDIKANNRDLIAKLKEVQRQFEEAQELLQEKITASLGDEASLPEDKAWVMVEEELENVKKLYLSFDRIMDGIKGQESFADDYAEGEKIDKIYREQFAAHFENARDHGFSLTTVEQMSSLLRNWVNNIGLGFRIYLKVFNKYPKRALGGKFTGASFKVVDSNTKVEVSPLNSDTPPKKTMGPFFYVIDGAPVPETEVLSEEEEAERKTLGKFSNSKLFVSMQPWVDLLANDKNDAFVVAYGNTGSGKTFALLDNPTSFVPRVIDYLKTEQADKVESIEYSAFEYLPNPNVGKHRTSYNFLSFESDDKRGKVCENQVPKWLKSGRNEGFYCSSQSLPWVPFTQESFTEACGRRATRATKGNAVSSRSHAVFLFKISLKGKDRDRYLGVFDLAGLETAGESGMSKETGWIKNTFEHFKLVFDRILSYKKTTNGKDFKTHINPLCNASASGRPENPAELLCQFMMDRGRNNPKNVKVSLIGTIQNDYDIAKTDTVIGNLMDWGAKADEQLKQELAFRKGMRSTETDEDDAESPDATGAPPPELTGQTSIESGYGGDAESGNESDRPNSSKSVDSDAEKATPEVIKDVEEEARRDMAKAQSEPTAKIAEQDALAALKKAKSEPKTGANTAGAA